MALHASGEVAGGAPREGQRPAPCSVPVPPESSPVLGVICNGPVGGHGTATLSTRLACSVDQTVEDTGSALVLKSSCRGSQEENGPPALVSPSTGGRRWGTLLFEPLNLSFLENYLYQCVFDLLVCEREPPPPRTPQASRESGCSGIDTPGEGEGPVSP